MAESRHPYAARTAVIATMHRKEEAVAPALMSTLGLIVTSAPGLDTDQLGTFSGEIPRDGAMLDVALRKARLGMSAAGVPLGLASEGSFGPHPAIPYIPAGMELLVFVNEERGIVVAESLITEKTNYDHLVISPGEASDAFLQKIGFPTHGLIVRPNEGEVASALAKGIVDPDRLRRAIETAAAASSDGRARMETDMRAHFNPTRMRSLAILAERLAQRLARQCPACGAPGFGRTGSRAGLLCETCGTPTELVVAEILGCPACDYTEERLRGDGLQRAPAQHCPLCNP
ncbi:hypothetical protein F7D13_06690 [Methylocystis rosea]|uniref:DUF6671 domain-containing protein n=1 Tax=Methylocystis rosea TaxID=173366 RepID=A0ABX6EGK4_9HYPH|nr:DUF6671 family protein [Methylocystis rosea]QGM93739.1 hypothetical protein F7D13_06690 [Methylocystis rosea]